MVPLQEPARYCLAPQLMLPQVAQRPFAAVEDPCRYWPGRQAGCLAQTPLDVAVWKLRYCPVGHLAWSLQVKPFVAPEHLPERYWLAGHATSEQAVQEPSATSVAPLRYWLVEHMGCSVHV